LQDPPDSYGEELVAHQVIMPRLSDSMEEGTVLEWLVARGDRVEVGQPLVEIETDKATVTYEAEIAGVILALNVSEGATVPLGAPIAMIGEPGEELTSVEHPERAGASASLDAGSRDPVTAGSGERAAARSAEPVAAGSGEPVAAGSGEPVDVGNASSGIASSSSSRRAKASPLARRLAAQLQVGLEGVTGSGPNGRVIRADVERAAAGAGNGASSGVGRAKGDTAVHDLTHVQRTVARRMAESRATVPDFELRCEVDMSRVVTVRERLREVADPLPSYNDFIVKAAALALRQFGRVNGTYRDGKVETHSRVNVGVAVAADETLVVPTIFDADRLSIGEISRKSRELAERVRNGSISPSDLGGATFTVSNLGMFGVDSFSAVINPPQAAILAVGSVKPRAIVDPEGSVVARPTVELTLACDHRVLYGADGARFLARLRELLEGPDALIL
jgi:pyruvate dehydrogenase E2 component (dihydrolipoamide acetyltransferase)